MAEINNHIKTLRTINGGDAMNTHERFYQVSQSQLSIARYYGGIQFNGVYHVYDPRTDTLTRDDILKAGVKEGKAKKKGRQRQAKAAQGEFEL